MDNNNKQLLRCPVGVRFAESDFKLLQEISASRGQSMSDFIRLAVKKEYARLSYLSDAEKKALGAEEKEMGKESHGAQRS